MKKPLISSIILLMVGFLTVQQDAQAQRIDLAPSLGYGLRVFNQVGDPGSLSAGLKAHIYLVEPDSNDTGLSLILNPDFDYYLFDIDGISGLQLSGNLLLGFGGRQSTIAPYVGLGLALTSVSGTEDPPQISDVTSGSAIGLNIIGGMLFGKRSPRIFSQLRYTLGEHELHREDNADPGSGLAYSGGIIFFLSD